ncbi:uncharacterized protein LOC111347535 [Stylophora pistillata]|nr:uncharacterized protein LOC111347535 [Stylophora pistillata]
MHTDTDTVTDTDKDPYKNLAALEAVLKLKSNGDNINFLVDPGSILLEMFSIYTLVKSPGNVKGSRAHADGVFQLANFWLNKLGKKNTFKPTVLAKVSRGEKYAIGCTMAVSHYLRPICLYNRIIRLKKPLREKIIHFDHMKLREDAKWEFRAFLRQAKDKGYDSKIDLCKNCQTFFIGDCWEEGHSTYLGACAEYCAVNELLPNEQTLEECTSEQTLEEYLLKRNLWRCERLFKDFRSISDICTKVCNRTEIDKSEVKEAYWKVIYKLHIFGLKPECSPYF